MWILHGTRELVTLMAGKNVHVKITRPGHPHYGERGRVVTNTKNTIKLTTVAGAEMFEVALIDCPHGVLTCMVTMADVKLSGNA